MRANLILIGENLLHDTAIFCRLPKYTTRLCLCQNTPHCQKQNFLFLAMRCVRANVSQNYIGTWQRHNPAVCFGKDQNITVSCSIFSLLIDIGGTGSALTDIL
jgi:hypothetical protein